MATPVILDSVTHHDLRVIDRYGAGFGDATNQMPVFPGEFTELQREYPIFFRPVDGDSFQPIALLGLGPQENLYLKGDHWDARYIPALRQRGPLLLGEDTQTPDLYIDLSHPLVSRSEGTPLFLPHGGQTPPLERARQALHLIRQGRDRLPDLFAAFTETALLAPVKVELRLNDGSQFRLPDLFTISAQGLSELSAAQLAYLHGKGYLALAFQVVNSVNNLQYLINVKNRQTAAVQETV